MAHKMKRITRRTSTDYYDSLVAYYSLLAYSPVRDLRLRVCGVRFLPVS